MRFFFSVKKRKDDKQVKESAKEGEIGGKGKSKKRKVQKKSEEEKLDVADKDENDEDDYHDMENEARKDLVAVGSYVAVATPEKCRKNYWLYKCVVKSSDTFVGLYYEETGKFTFRQTNTKEDVCFASVIYPDVQLTPMKKKRHFSISPEQDIEINQHAIF